MSTAIEHLKAAMAHAASIRPKVGGFPHLAEALRKAGVTRNEWILPACQSIYVTELGTVVSTGQPLASGMAELPRFDREALIKALRDDQEGRTVFPHFLTEAWKAGVLRYEVDFGARKVSYYGACGEAYVEEYPAVELHDR